MSDISKARVKGVVYDIKDERARNLVEQHELAIQEILENYARMDGYYETMGVGVATNLKGSNTSVAKFVYRKSGGSESVDSGLAQLTAMRGKSVVWNQLVNGLNQSGFNPISYSDGVFTINFAQTSSEMWRDYLIGTMNITRERKYILYVKYISGTLTGNIKISDGSNAYILLNADRDSIKLVTAHTSKTSPGFGLLLGADSSATAYKCKICIFDLTLMFGAGNEPSTVEEFEAMFPNDYYPYNEGSLLNFNATSLKTVGFNQIDLSGCEFGTYNQTTGVLVNNTSVVRCWMPVIGGSSYYIKMGTNIRQDSNGIGWYDAEHNYLGEANYTSALVVAPLSAAFGLVVLRAISGTTTLEMVRTSGLCINLSDPSKNGTYEPYWASNLPLNINTQTGKLNGSGESIVVFPNGMAGMNGVQDTIIGNVATKRFTQVNNLTSLPITLNYEGYAPEVEEGDTVYSFILELPKNAKAFTASVMNGLFNKKYSASYGISAASYNNFYIYTLQGKSYVEIMDNDFATDARFADEEEWDALIADIRTSLADKMLLYELSIQEEYILDGIELPLNYKVDKNGTEQIVPNTSDPDNNIPSTTPCDMDIVYSIDAANTIINLPNNYVSATQQQSFSTSQQAQARENIGLSNVATKYKTTIQGDGNNEYTITHNLSSTSVFVVVQDASTLEQISGYQVVSDSANQIRIVFNEEIGVGTTYNILILS